MAKKTRVWVEAKGVHDLLKSDEVAKMLQEVAAQKVANVKGSYKTELKTGSTRKYIHISPADKKTYYRNLNSNELIKAVGV